MQTLSVLRKSVIVLAFMLLSCSKAQHFITVSDAILQAFVPTDCILCVSLGQIWDASASQCNDTTSSTAQNISAITDIGGCLTNGFAPATQYTSTLTQLDYTSQADTSTVAFPSFGTRNNTLEVLLNYTNLAGHVVNLFLFCSSNNNFIWAGIQDYNSPNFTEVPLDCSSSTNVLNNQSLVIVADTAQSSVTLEIKASNTLFRTNYTQSTASSCTVDTDCPYTGCCSTNKVCMPGAWNGATVFDNYNSTSGKAQGTYSFQCASNTTTLCTQDSDCNNGTSSTCCMSVMFNYGGDYSKGMSCASSSQNSKSISLGNGYVGIGTCSFAHKWQFSTMVAIVSASFIIFW